METPLTNKKMKTTELVHFILTSIVFLFFPSQGLIVLLSNIGQLSKQPELIGLTALAFKVGSSLAFPILILGLLLRLIIPAWRPEKKKIYKYWEFWAIILFVILYMTMPILVDKYPIPMYEY